MQGVKFGVDSSRDAADWNKAIARGSPIHWQSFVLLAALVDSESSTDNTFSEIAADLGDFFVSDSDLVGLKKRYWCNLVDL